MLAHSNCKRIPIIVTEYNYWIHCNLTEIMGLSLASSSHSMTPCPTPRPCNLGTYNLSNLCPSDSTECPQDSERIRVEECDTGDVIPPPRVNPYHEMLNVNAHASETELVVVDDPLR